GVQELTPVFFGQERAFIDTHAGRRAEPGAKNLWHDARLLFMPMGLSGATRPISVIAARHHVAYARLLVAVVIVVGCEDVAKTVHARLIFIAEVVSNQFQVLAVKVAAPNRAALAVGMVGGPLPAFAVGAL